MAAITYSSRSKVVRMMTRVGRVPSAAPDSNAVMRRVASMPSMPGMRTSISTTSGCNDSATRTASAPSRACPTTCISCWEPITIAKPARTSSWSSAMTTRIRCIAFMPSTVAN